MRIIVNIHSNQVAAISGWRARAIQINGKSESDLKEALKAVIFENGAALFDVIIDKNRLRGEIKLFVNGDRMPETPDFKTRIKDNIQIHIMGKLRS